MDLRHNRINYLAYWLLFGVLAAYTLWIGEYGYGGALVVNRVITAILMGFLSAHLFLDVSRRVHWSPVFLCPLGMCLYGLLQTIFSSQKIVFQGLDQSLFWFSVAAIGYLATDVFQRSISGPFRIGVAFLGGFEAGLSLLQQAFQTDRYFGLFSSRTSHVYGTFGYANNFAQFIELTLPVTTWHAIRNKESQTYFLLLAVIQIGATVASGSRAGTVLVFLEFFVVLLLGWVKCRALLPTKSIVLALFLMIGAVYVAGFGRVVEKFKQPDQFGGRALTNKASIEMISKRPFTGWGLGSFQWTYRRFALYDDGTPMGRAHNDYLEWAAEGGILYGCTMLLLVGWTLLNAPRRAWAIGLLAFDLHAVVDFPFARLGTAGWYFALAGMLTSSMKTSRSPISFESDSQESTAHR